MSDAEGDSHMASSSEGSVDDADSMFPDANEPSTAVQTPQTSNLQYKQQFSELSPPASEGPTDPQLSGYDPMNQANNADVSSFPDAFAGITYVDSQAQGGPSLADQKPGSSWNSRKHQDEEALVREDLLDKSFSLKEFGDIYTAEDMSDEV
ncbi:MAG: hypothetical protein Q9207_007822 [Kuettlingeria erythrocarpa]